MCQGRMKHKEQDEMCGGQDKAHGEQCETHREQDETHGECDVSCGEQTENQELWNVTTPMYHRPQEILLLRPCNPATRHSTRQGRPKGSINRRR